MNIERKNSVRIFLDIFFSTVCTPHIKGKAYRQTDRQRDRQRTDRENTERENKEQREQKKVSIDHKIFMFFFLICFNRLLNFVCEVKGRI